MATYKYFWAKATLVVLPWSALSFMVSGCNPPAAPPAKVEEEHSHSHSHRHGAHGGEIAVVEPGDFDIEWRHNSDNGEVKIYVDEITSAGKKVEKVVVKTSIGSGEPTTYEFTAGADGVYTATNVDLVTAIDASTDEAGGSTANVVVTVDGQEHSALLLNMHH